MKRFVLFFLGALACASSSLAAATSCPEHFFHGAAPIVTNAAMLPRTHELCFEGFAVLHSAITRTPLYSAEHLTRARLEDAAQLPRINSFHLEPHLRPADRSTLNDYKRSG